CGLLQILLLSLYSKTRQSMSEIRESLCPTPRIFPLSRNENRRLARSALCGVGRSLIQDGSLRKSNVRFRLPHETDIQAPDESRDRRDVPEADSVLGPLP